MITVVLSFLVGCVFLFTGLIKVVYSRPFIVHVRNLGILPRSLNEIAASVFIQLECGFGTALVLFAFPAELIPTLMGLILILSAVTVWGVQKGRVEDCGCYGGWLSLNLMQSLGLNCVYVTMLAVAWISLDENPPVAMWKVLMIIGVMALSNFMIRGSANSPLIDMSPLKPGRKWNPRWSDPSDIKRYETGSILYIFMSHRCYRCKDWDPYIINLLQRSDQPFPVLIFPETEIEPEKRLADVPHQHIRPGIFRYLVYRTPTAVHVKEGRIEGRWVVRFPDEFI